MDDTLGTTSCQLTQTKFSFLVKSINFWSYLKVYTGIKEKKLKKKIFSAWRKTIFRPMKFLR